jgi:3'-phosphoadenosine 5'-phosphosulfate sulfotransferase (PAPS reductase)/FAD synthetase
MKKFETGCGYYSIVPQEELKDMKHVVSFSGGRTSAYLLHRMIQEYGKENLIINFANTGRESFETLLFVANCEELFKIKINWIEFDLNEENKPAFKIVNFDNASRNGEPLYKAIKYSKYVPNVMQRRCTIVSKIEAMQMFLKSIDCTKDNSIQYLGIRYDEPKRWSKYINQFDGNNIIKAYPLVDWKITKKDILDFWKQQPFDLTIEEPWGNCDLCFLKSTKRRIAVLKQKPEIATFWSAIENEMGNKFDNQFSVKQLLKIATGQTIEDVSKFRNYDIDCTCNLD